jgi:glutathione S-transferase
VTEAAGRLQLFGAPWSRASRCLWMLEELGVPYESVTVRDTRSPEHLARNPNGRVPVLVDGDVALFESLAINLYLAKRFPSPLSAATLAEEGRIVQWSMWAQSEMEAALNGIASLETVPAEWRERTLGVLDGALRGDGQLVGGRFTVADLNLANMFNGPVSSRFDLSPHPALANWLERCRARPAARRVFARAAAGFAEERARKSGPQ